MELFDVFLQERLYLKGVSGATIRYYGNVRAAMAPVIETPTKAVMLSQIQALLARGLSPVSVNAWRLGVKAYVRWLHEEGHITEVFTVQFLKTETKVLATLSSEQITALVRFSPSGVNERRAWLAAILICDTGLRISEALGLCKDDVELEQCTLRVIGKGGKHRVVPFSKEMRKRLYLYLRQHKQHYVFATGSGGKVTVRNLERDFAGVCKKAGIEGIRASPHALRHSFAKGTTLVEVCSKQRQGTGNHKTDKD